MMKKRQIIFERITKKLSAPLYCSFWVAILILGLQLPAAQAATEATKGALPIPGTTETKEYLTLKDNGVILSNDQVYLVWTASGNLELSFYRQQIIWESNTTDKGKILSFEASDGILKIQDAGGNIIWSTKVSGGEKLKVGANRNLTMLSSSGQVIWQTSTILGQMSTATLFNISAVGEMAQDLRIPDQPGSRYLYLYARGADGGSRKVKEIDGSTRFIVNGGGGAGIEATFEIGTGDNMIPPGSIVRFIVGKRGETRTGQTTAGCPGGGGTAVLVKKPNAASWYMLLAAGGGGGAYSDCCTDKKEGKSAETGTSGSKGGGSYGGAGGTNGNHGDNPTGSTQYDASPGGGAFQSQQSGSGEPGWLQGDSNPNSLPTGGKGGWGGWDEHLGGWGFGGGGGPGYGGGGGGGYSGGGCAQAYHGGGGGGSYVNSDMAIEQIKKKNPTARSPNDGFVQYQFTNSGVLYNVMHFAKDQSKCIDVSGGNTSPGTNVQIWDCNGGTAQNWFFEGITVKFAKDPSKCLDLFHSNTYNGANIQLWDCNGADAQKWIYDGITSAIRSKVNLDYCVDMVNGKTANGSNIELYKCDDVMTQRWIVDRATLPGVSDNYNWIHIAAAPDKCVDVAAANTANGTNVQVYHCHSQDSQHWYFDGSMIRFNKDRNKCLDLDSSNTANGANIQLYACNGTNAQKWIYDALAQSFRSWINPDKCIDVKESKFEDYNNIQLHDCNGTTAQQFVIK